MGRDISDVNWKDLNGLIGIVFAVSLLLGCGMQGQGNYASLEDTGSVTFSVKWVPSRTAVATEALDAPLASPLAATPDICTAYSVTQVHLEVWRDGTLPTSTGVSATAPCTAHTATLAGVPAQVPDLYVKLTANPQGWEGESARFTLSSGGTQDLGDIVVDIPPMWHAAESIGVNSANTSDPDVGMDDSGNAIAVWMQGTDRIYASRFTPGAGWGTETAIGGAGGAISVDVPRVAMSANGDAIVAWVNLEYNIMFDKNLYAVDIARFTPGGGWESSTPMSIGAETWSQTGDPRIAMDDSGNAVVVWSMNTKGATGTVFDIFASRYSASSSSWALISLTQLAFGTNALYPQVAMAGGGSAMVVWEETTGDIYAQRFDGAAWENTPAVIGTWNSAVLSAEPQVAMDGSGNAIATWKSHQIVKPSPGGLGGYWADVISTNRFAASIGAWGDSSSIVDIGDGYLASGLLIAMNSDGNAAACWNLRAPPPGMSAAGAATTYDSVTGLWDASVQPMGICDDIGMDDSGNAIVVDNTAWVTPVTVDIVAYHYTTAAMAWDSPVTIQSDAQGDGPRVAVNSGGEAIAVWTQSDGSYIRPYASRYY